MLVTGLVIAVVRTARADGGPDPARDPAPPRARAAHAGDPHADHCGGAAHAGDPHAAHAADPHATHAAGDHAAHEAEHHGTLLGAHHRHAHGASYTASLGLIAATYDARLFTGDYQGVVAGVRWARGRFGAAVTVPAYRLQKNGKVVDGVGDVMAHGHLTLVTRGAAAAGVMAMVSVPTGDDMAGLGMGHVMVMPELWAAWASPAFAIVGSIGYSRALGGASAHAEHGGGMWPLVDPMNASEVPFGATAMLALASQLGVGARVAGALPAGDGDARLYGGPRLVWSEGRVDTSAEILGGMVGDPFDLRGVVEIAVRF